MHFHRNWFALAHCNVLWALLEDRFHLRTHRETREIPVYFLTVAKGGLKAKAFREGSCVPIDLGAMLTQFPPPELAELPAGQKYCLARGTNKGTNNYVEAEGTTVDAFIHFDLGHLDRPVINNTGLKGRFYFHLEDAPPDRPSIFTALQQQLGLKLETGKGPGEFLVIDGVERATEN